LKTSLFVCCCSFACMVLLLASLVGSVLELLVSLILEMLGLLVVILILLRKDFFGLSGPKNLCCFVRDDGDSAPRTLLLLSVGEARTEARPTPPGDAGGDMASIVNFSILRLRCPASFMLLFDTMGTILPCSEMLLLLLLLLLGD
jgi:hypothetical protein